MENENQAERQKTKRDKNSKTKEINRGKRGDR
jgi:hypothetical protein